MYKGDFIFNNHSENINHSLNIATLNNNNNNNKKHSTETLYYKNMFACDKWIYQWCIENYSPFVTGTSIANIIGISHHYGEGFASQRPSLIRALILKERNTNSTLLPNIENGENYYQLPSIKKVTSFGNSQEERLHEFKEFYNKLKNTSFTYKEGENSTMESSLFLPGIDKRYERRKKREMNDKNYQKKRLKTLFKKSSYLNKKNSINKLKGVSNNDNKKDVSFLINNNSNSLPCIEEMQLLNNFHDKEISYDELATFWGVQMEYGVSKMLQNAFSFNSTFPSSNLNSNIHYYEKNPTIYATSDGILKDAVCGKATSLLEIKCPFSGILPRFIRINDYLQMLLQMNCYQIDNVIHIVWIPSGFVIWYIENDVSLWNYIEENFINKNREIISDREWEENELLSIQIRISIERHSTKIGYYLDKNQYGQRIQIFFCLNRKVLVNDLKNISVDEMDTMKIFSNFDRDSEKSSSLLKNEKQNHLNNDDEKIKLTTINDDEKIKLTTINDDEKIKLTTINDDERIKLTTINDNEKIKLTTINNDERIKLTTINNNENINISKTIGYNKILIINNDNDDDEENYHLKN